MINKKKYITVTLPKNTFFKSQPNSKGSEFVLKIIEDMCE